MSFTVNPHLTELILNIYSDIIFICLEHVQNQVEKIYVYASFEDNMISCDYFYSINHKIVKRHKLSGNDQQLNVLDTILEDIDKIYQLCKERKLTMPTEFKLIYDINTEKLDVSYKYEPVWSCNSQNLSDDIFEEWFEEIRRNNNEYCE